MSEEREVKDLENEEQDDVEAHKKAHAHPADSTSNDDGDDVEAHVKKSRLD